MARPRIGATTISFRKGIILKATTFKTYKLHLKKKEAFSAELCNVM